MKKQNGVTLIELMIAIAVLAVLLGIGIPSFQDTIRTNRTAAVTNDMVAALQFARSEAVRRGAPVRLCLGGNTTVCNGALANGWFVTTDVTADPIAAASALRVWPQPRAGVAFGGGGVVTFGAMGQLIPAGPVSVDIQFAGCSGNQARSVAVNNAGRVISESRACF